MFSRKITPAPPVRTHSVSVRFGRVMEVQAEGWGLVVAPILALIVIVAVTAGVWLGGSTATTVGGRALTRMAQAEPAVGERPPQND